MSNMKGKREMGRRRPPSRPPGGGGGRWGLLFWVLSIFMLVLVVSALMPPGGFSSRPSTPKLADIDERLEKGDVEWVELRDDSITVKMNSQELYRRELQPEMVAKYRERCQELKRLGKIVSYDYKAPSTLMNSIVANLFLGLGVVLLFYFLMVRPMRSPGGPGGVLNFGKSRAMLLSKERTQTTFDDVAGIDEAKEEVREIIEFLKTPAKFQKLGGRIPRGVLLVGPPGTGKTLLAKAIAGEAGVPFFSISGSDFVEMFVGVGASRVRDLFRQAKEKAPCIIFLDEIDAVGRRRGSGNGGGDHEREQTLNAILVEIDGFSSDSEVIVMAATNRPDVLDPALLRPGRFDRRVTIDLPDREDRIAILGIHARKKPLAEDVDLSVIAQRTPGFSGADLYSLMNEGAILAAREERKKVAQFDLIRSIEKVMLGPERKSHVLSKREREITAYHEAGHALVSSVLPYADPVQKISIISRGRAAGYTLKLPDQDRRMQSRKEFLDDIAASLGGYVAEEMIFDDLTTGPSNDLQVLTGLARDMVTKYGMSKVFGPMVLEGMGGRLIGGGLSEDRGYGDEVAEKIDAEVKKIIDEARTSAKEILVRYRVALDAVAARLLVVEALEREEYETILKAQGVEVKDYYRDLEGMPLPKGDPTKILEPDSDVLA